MKLLLNQDIGWRTGESPDLYLPLSKIVESATIHIFLSKIFLSYDSTKERSKSAEAKYADIAGKPRPKSAKSSFSRN